MFNFQLQKTSLASFNEGKNQLLCKKTKKSAILMTIWMVDTFLIVNIDIEKGKLIQSLKVNGRNIRK